MVGNKGGAMRRAWELGWGSLCSEGLAVEPMGMWRLLGVLCGRAHPWELQHRRPVLWEWRADPEQCVTRPQGMSPSPEAAAWGQEGRGLAHRHRGALW